jgi:TetR/AcrR family transcriptional regulator, transcriptional repressor for nem operon
VSEHLTKTRILEAAEELLLERSFQAVSLNEILAAVKIPKGCFYHHFDSKEAFGCELIKHYAEDSKKMISQLLLNREMEPNARLRILAHYESGIAKFISNNGKCPCLLMKLASETSFSSPAMREEISRAYHTLVGVYEEVIQEGQDQGDISKRWDAKFTASIITSLWLGAIEKALIHKRVDIMRDALECISGTILAPAQILSKSA